MGLPTTNKNDANLEQRHDFVKSVLSEVFGFEARKIHPIAYEENFPFPYNNFVFHVEVERTPLSVDKLAEVRQCPGVHEIPLGLGSFIMRLSNHEAGYNDKHRVENEVAAMGIARQATMPDFPNLIPQIFGWRSGSTGHGWILQERMPGVPILGQFGSMSDADKKCILKQMARVLACLQRYQLPSTIQEFGGLSFDSSGSPVSAPLSIMDGGPYQTYPALIAGTVQDKLAKADSDPRIQGWRPNNLRARLEKFVEQGLRKVAGDMTCHRKVLVHADFSIDNVLYDEITKRLTAVLDFDFSHVATVADEFFRSLGHGIGRFPGAEEKDEEVVALREAMLHGFPTSLPNDSKEVQWFAAKAWDDALRDEHAERPGTIPNMAVLSDLYSLSAEILPFKLCNEVVVSNSSEEQLRARRADSESHLMDFLKRHGF